MSRVLLFCGLALFSVTSWAQGLVVSTQPIYLIAKDVLKGVEQPKLLLDHQSGHDVSLTPAHRKTVQDANLVIWLGKAHEAPLAKMLNENGKSVAILDSGIISALPLRDVRGNAIKNSVDTHVWLDPNNAVRIGFFIAALRSQQYPNHKEAYWANARAFAQKLLLTSQKVDVSSRAQPYWAYHDAYQYLERALNLNFAGAMTDDPHVAPTLAQIKYLKDHRLQPKICLLAEAHTSQNQYQKLGAVVFQPVDETMSGAGDFITAWKTLADQTLKCTLNARK
ncbi:zinc ABC transporter substrate-binding protein [Acinetobacter sp. ANC 5054]|uniref:metal ABC transporter solute-binding protein, Zn/Mn family n=1 Tax=Acinetobacter sp. ANC 5054 TaxID=1977877 RepID=UPI000A32CAF1|nr:zinc ABC transporter substrate-binding protein [Acinetobacter sp. ANC 5054]OTG80134.1 zinc ABC transporter substrate-binding protein [Acinetobacter sp. ANC 5054]